MSVIKTLPGADGTFTLYDTEARDMISDLSADIPDYWQTYMDEKVETIQGLDGDIGNHGISFIFITDEHWPNNYQVSPDLIKYIQNHTSVKTVVNGGDVLTKHSEISTALGYLADFRNQMPDGMFSILGNHDLNSNGSNDSTLWLSADQFYGTMLKGVEEDVTWGDELYYYKDFDNAKVRMIFLDSGYDEAIGLGTTQLAWLQQRLYELGDGWTAIVFQHYVWNAATADTESLTMGAPGTAVKNIIDGQYANMTAHGAAFAGVICGHSHRDYYVTTDNGYSFITTTCDANGAQAAYDPDNPTRTSGTTTEQAFDVVHIDTTARSITMTRIGAGEDRTFTY